MTSMAFEIKDCTLITRMAGVDSALNLRELRERLLSCPVECLFHHFSETVIRPTFDDHQFRNDFAVWAARHLRDRALAERLGVLNPYSFASFEELRARTIDIIDEHLSESHHLQWVPRGDDFRFMRAVTVVFGTGINLEYPQDLIKALPEMSLSSIYFHFVEARRRTENRTDDFSVWLDGYGPETKPIQTRLAEVDFYFMTLKEVKAALISALEESQTKALYA